MSNRLLYGETDQLGLTGFFQVPHLVPGQRHVPGSMSGRGLVRDQKGILPRGLPSRQVIDTGHDPLTFSTA